MSCFPFHLRMYANQRADGDEPMKPRLSSSLFCLSSEEALYFQQFSFLHSSFLLPRFVMFQQKLALLSSPLLRLFVVTLHDTRLLRLQRQRRHFRFHRPQILFQLFHFLHGLFFRDIQVLRHLDVLSLRERLRPQQLRFLRPGLADELVENSFHGPASTARKFAQRHLQHFHRRALLLDVPLEVFVLLLSLLRRHVPVLLDVRQLHGFGLIQPVRQFPSLLRLAVGSGGENGKLAAEKGDLLAAALEVRHARVAVRVILGLRGVE
mmetsp:Transcript_23006/g.58142  ORF Transcript_23006/g.58142 Transcript_23006/m.58142 type:complete len:265 (+) Transcript_23006:250-1044(+)